VGMVSGHYHGLPNQTFVIEFFASQPCDPSGFGEGGRYLGFATITTDASGDADFLAGNLMLIGAGESITATARQSGAQGSTSEFSKCHTTFKLQKAVIKE